MQKRTDYIAVLASGARTTAQTSQDFVNEQHRGVKVVVDITAYTSGSLTVTISGKDRVSGKTYTLLASAALAAAATTVLTVYPGLTAAGNLTATNVLPDLWQVTCAVGDATSITYSIGASLLV